VRRDARTPILYLAPWVDFGGTDKGTIDWFRWLDRDRFAAFLATTQPSPNRRIAEVLPYAEEVWPLPELMSGSRIPRAVLDLVHTREIEVLHLMNSRLGYDLLPDLRCVANPPRVVVQLHVEEAERTGYVRYVTTRYGNLVDAFSVTSEHLAEAVHGYGVPRDKIHVIYTGVDAEQEFAPGRTRPVEGLPADRTHILYPGRLVAQKDPLLMADVAEALRDRGLAFQIHAVGEGDLEPELRQRIEERGLNEHVRIHPPTDRLQAWYEASDVLLMTSVFEGVPYVVYEAMAMGIPTVAPALPGNVELLDDTAGGLIEPRDDVRGYVEALVPLLDDPAARMALGERARSLARERFTLQAMAADHERLYEDLLSSSPERPSEQRPRELPGPVRFRRRRLFETPLVSVLVPCFNQGRVLGECLDAIRSQTHPAVETIVVDDASTDSETIAVMDALEDDPDVTVIRMAKNGGPSRARNAALERCSGRYVLPVDSDNVLLPDAVEQLVAQLKVAGEQVGFIYPNIQYFGNRDDYFEAPPWNLYRLLHGNICDVCSLFDREVFDAGERFDEAIRLGHEDWELVLRLAARGIQGQRARGKTLLYRKWGFNRSDSVEYAPTSFNQLMHTRSPFAGREALVKSHWSPAASIIALEPLDATSEAGARLAHRLAIQSCRDFELVARFDGQWPGPAPTPNVRRLPPALTSSPGEALADARLVARGRLLIATAGTGTSLLADAAFVEKLLRLFEELGTDDGGLVMVDAGTRGHFPLRLLDEDEPGEAHTVVWPVAAELPVTKGLRVNAEDPIGSLAEGCSGLLLTTQRRHWPVATDARRPGSAEVHLPTGERLPERREAVLEDRLRRPPLIPRMPGDAVPRWHYSPTWLPPQSMILCRHRELATGRRIVTNDRIPPAGFEIEYDLGCVRALSLAGTARLVELAQGGYATNREGRSLGYVEEVAFPLLEPLYSARHLPTDEEILVCGDADPQMGEIEPIQVLGFIEPYPLNPRFMPHIEATRGLKGLTRSVDHAARRHRYAAGALAEGELVTELGALFETPLFEATPLWIVDGWAVTEEDGPRRRRPALPDAARWTLAPLRWRGFSQPSPRARAILRRGAGATLTMLRGPSVRNVDPNGEPAGWLLTERRIGTVPLYAAYHPVTGDQLLSTSPGEAPQMGYGQPKLLGHLRALTPLTRSTERRVVGVPWASRFGLEVHR
jgi:glycosyltransferase involved in cell wall biosynthesis/GT2 family glycosyltransferase